MVVVDQVLVAERDADNALHDQRGNLMLDQVRTARVGEAGGEALDQPDRPVGAAQQQCPGVRGDRAAVKRGHHGAALNGCKLQLRRATLCRHRGPPLLSGKALLQKNFRRFRAPVHLPRVRDAGYNDLRLMSVHDGRELTTDHIAPFRAAREIG